MIVLYESNSSDYTSLGLAVLNPVECTVSEIAGGSYELNLVHPITSDGKHSLLKCGRIIKAPCPVRESPIIEYESGGSSAQTVTRHVYKVVNISSRLYVRNSPNGTKISYLNVNDEVQKLGEDTSTGSTWYKIATMKGGVTGYCISGEGGVPYFQDTGRTVTVTIGNDTPSSITSVTLSKTQLFRIYSVEISSENRMVTVNARHITYDLVGVHSKTSYSVDEYIYQLMARFTNTSYFTHDCGIACTDYSKKKVKVALSNKNALEALLSDTDGAVTQSGVRLVRDNFNLYTLPKDDRQLGFEVRYGKNLLSASYTKDISDVVTAVLPLGKTATDGALWGTIQNSSHISEYGNITRVIRYDVKAASTSTADVNAAKASLNAHARAEFTDNHIDEPVVTLDAEFVALDLAPKYLALANEYSMHLYDSIRVYDPDAGIDMTVAMTEYTFDVLAQKYTSVTLGTPNEINI